MLLIDGVRYKLWTPPSEDEFEKVVEKHAEEIFGKDAKYFDLKHRLASRSGTGSIPDGYVLTLWDKPEVRIIELELASHSLQHIVSQMVNIINGIENPTTQQKICNAIEDGINQDESFAAKIVKAIKPVAIHRFLSDSFSNKLPIINIIIDRSSPELKEAIGKITPPPRVIEFQTLTREGVAGLAVHAHLFEPLAVEPPSDALVLFLEEVQEKFTEKKPTVTSSEVSGRHFCYIPMKRHEGIHTEWLFWGKGGLGVELHLERASRRENLLLFKKLESIRNELGEKIGEQLEFEDTWHPHKKGARIYTLKEPVEPTVELKEWAVKTMIKFYEVFTPLLDEIDIIL